MTEVDARHGTRPFALLRAPRRLVCGYSNGTKRMCHGLLVSVMPGGALHVRHHELPSKESVVDRAIRRDAGEVVPRLPTIRHDLRLEWDDIPDVFVVVCKRGHPTRIDGAWLREELPRGYGG